MIVVNSELENSELENSELEKGCVPWPTLLPRLLVQRVPGLRSKVHSAAHSAVHSEALCQRQRA